MYFAFIRFVARFVFYLYTYVIFLVYHINNILTVVPECSGSEIIMQTDDVRVVNVLPGFEASSRGGHVRERVKTPQGVIVAALTVRNTE